MAFSKSVLAFVATISLACAAVALPGMQDHQNYSYALATKDGNAVTGNWNGSFNDSLARQRGPDRLLVQRNGKMYVITDRATIDQMRKSVEPMIQIGNKQSALGEQQSKLGEEQSKIGEQQSALGEKMGALGERLGKIAEASAHGEQASNEAEQDKIQNEMSALQTKMDALNQKMEGPSHKQEALGKRQEALGRQQERAQKIAEPKIERIIDAAFAKGLAKAV